MKGSDWHLMLCILFILQSGFAVAEASYQMKTLNGLIGTVLCSRLREKCPCQAYSGKPAALSNLYWGPSHLRGFNKKATALCQCLQNVIDHKPAENKFASWATKILMQVSL